MPLWHMTLTNGILLNVPDDQISITGVAVTAYLCIVGTRFTHRTTLRETFLIVLFLTFCFLVSLLLGYANWGIITGLFWHPDAETIKVEVGIVGLGLFLMIAGFFVATAIRHALRLSRTYSKSDE